MKDRIIKLTRLDLIDSNTSTHNVMLSSFKLSSLSIEDAEAASKIVFIDGDTILVIKNRGNK